MASKFTDEQIADFNNELSSVGYTFNPNLSSTSQLSPGAKEVIYSDRANAFAVGPINGRNKASSKNMSGMVNHISNVESLTPEGIAKINEELSHVGYTFNPNLSSTSQLSPGAKEVIYSDKEGAFVVGPIGNNKTQSKKTIPKMVDYIAGTMSKGQLKTLVHHNFAATAVKGGRRRRSRSRKQSRKRSKKSKRRRTAKKSKRSKSRSRSRKRSKRR